MTGAPDWVLVVIWYLGLLGFIGAVLYHTALENKRIREDKTDE